MSTLGVVILTYAPSVKSPRHTYACITAESLRDHIWCSHDIRWHIADDGSSEEHIKGLQNLLPQSSVSIAPRLGYGASYNLATQILHATCEYFLMIEDDWRLTRPLDLDPLIQALDEGLNCIRLGYIGWTQELRGKVAKYGGQSFLEFDPESPEPHVWAGHPRIETRNFQRSVGPWPEGIDPGSTEFVVAKRAESRQKIGWPLDIAVNASQQAANLFAHIGAQQARTDQLEAVDA